MGFGEQTGTMIEVGTVKSAGAVSSPEASSFSAL